MATETGTEASAFAEDEQASRKMLDLIKARTMYQMVEELDNGAQRLLFLTNSQAEQIAKRPESVQKMLDVLEVGKPQLVINLVTSAGFRESSKLLPTSQQTVVEDGFMGSCKNMAPFCSREEEQTAEAKVDVFMSEVLIPLAVSTNAIVLCNALRGACILSTSFMRMCCVTRWKWGGRLPFTVISYTGDIEVLYGNLNEGARTSVEQWSE